MPLLVRFLLVHAAIGFAIAFVLVGIVLAVDFDGLRTLMLASDVGLVALFMFTFFSGLTCASVQIGAAVMLLGEDSGNDQSGGHFLSRMRDHVRAWLAPPPKRIPVPIKK